MRCKVRVLTSTFQLMVQRRLDENQRGRIDTLARLLGKVTVTVMEGLIVTMRTAAPTENHSRHRAARALRTVTARLHLKSLLPDGME